MYIFAAHVSKECGLPLRKAMCQGFEHGEPPPLPRSRPSNVSTSYIIQDFSTSYLIQPVLGE